MVQGWVVLTQQKSGTPGRVLSGYACPLKKGADRSEIYALMYLKLFA